ncbi:MAG: HAD family hydrolase [Christensenellales bacterium]
MGGIRLIVVDLDGTLLRNDKSISSFSKKSIADARTKGIRFAFASARGASTERYIAENLFDAYILCNGAAIYADGKCIRRNRIEPAVYVPFLRGLSQKGIPVAAEVENLCYANFAPSEKWPLYAPNVFTDFSDVQNTLGILESADKLHAHPRSADDIAAIENTLPDFLYLKMSRDGLAMIMHQEATKSNGIKCLAEHYGIELSDVAAFGDDVNDIDMLKTVGIGIAMGNAVAEVKQIASEVCLSNEEDGVAHWIRKFCLS